MAALQALGLTLRQELLWLDLEQGVIGERQQLATARDQRGLLLALDRRPASGGVLALTGLTERSERMTLLPLSPGAAGTAAVRRQELAVPLDLPLPEGVRIAFDPLQDDLRAVTPDGRSFRVDPESGALRQDATLTLERGGPGLRIAAAAYARAVAGAARAPLYLLDLAQQALLVEDPRSPGRLEYVGALGIALRALCAFRIFSTPAGHDTAILLDGHRVYTLDLLNGQAWERAYFEGQDLVVTDMAPLFA